MAKRKRKNNKEPLLFIMIFALITLIINMVRVILYFIYNLISYYKSGYKKKTNISFLKMYLDKGNYGEFQFYKKLIKVIKADNIFLNVYLENENTEHTEIDIMAVTEKAVYVFEIKNYGGWIYGDDNDKYWTQTFNKYSKHKFYNPLRQNYAHVKAVEKHLEISNEKIIPIIAFSNRSKLKKIEARDNNYIFNFKSAIKKVRELENSSVEVFVTTEVDNMIELVTPNVLVSDEIKNKHIEQVIELKSKN